MKRNYETLAQRMVREVRQAEEAGIELGARDFDAIARIGLATAASDMLAGHGGDVWGEEGDNAFDNAIDDATHMTDRARERAYRETP